MIFAHIETENDIQLDDRTRFDASKTHVTSNQPAFTKLTIKPGMDQAAISVYNTNPKSRYLDWECSTWNMDIDSSNNKIDFSEGGPALVATITGGTYSLTALAAQIKTQLDAAGALTYTVTLSIDNEMTISATGDFELLLSTGLNRDFNLLSKLYFGTSDLALSDSYESGIIESLIKKITTTAGENKYQIDQVTCVADVANSLNSKYFFLQADADITLYYVWYNTGGGVDPALVGYIGLEVSISTNATASAVATATAAVINGDASFNAVSNSAIVTITHTTANWNTAPLEALGTGFSFSTPTPGEAPDSESIYINVYSVRGDYLFSNDAELVQFDPDIRRWVQDGRNSFLNVHRQAQKHIIEWLDRVGYRNSTGQKYTKFDLLDLSEVNEWSRYTALRMIYEGIKVSQDDVYKAKRQTFSDKEMAARNRAFLKLDTYKTGVPVNTNINNSVGLFRQ